jgi:hypothetical protein
MKEDLFDKKIREKFEQIDKPVSSEAWSKLSKTLGTAWWLIFLQKYALPLYAALATGFLGYFLFQNQELNQKVDTLGDRFLQIENRESTVQTIVHKDTVYIEKTIYLKQGSQVALSDSKLSELTKYVVQLQKAFDGLVTKVEKEERVTESKNQESAKELKTLVKTMTDNNQKVIEAIEEAPLLTEKKLREDSLLVPDRRFPEAEGVPAKKKFSLPKVESRLGLEAGVSSQQSFVLGPVFEYFFNPSMSVTAGAQIHNFREMEYFGTQGFNQATGKDFVKLYGSQISAYDNIKDIYIKNTAFEIPLKVNYYMPLKQDFDLMLSYGTHLDIKGYQSLKAEYDYKGESIYQKIQTKGNTDLLHNMIFGLGLQYRRQNYIFKLTPSFTYNFREVDFQKSGGVFTLSGGVFLKLNK